MLQPGSQSGSIAEDTAKLARRIYRKGNPYLGLRDKLGVVYEDEVFAELYSTQGQPAVSPGTLAQVLVLQFIEGLSDRQAADAVRSRIDWKYLLGLPLGDEGFEASVLSEFRSRLVEGGVETLLLERLLESCRSQGLVKERGKQRTDSTHVLAAVAGLNRVELVLETLLHTLETLAKVAPVWLQEHLDGDWFHRYGEELTLWGLPEPGKKRDALTKLVGGDGYILLETLYASEEKWLCQAPAVETLRQIWIQQYYREAGKVHWRTQKQLPPSAILLQSPYDLEAHWAVKGNTKWLGYKVHVTESCDADSPHLIVDVQTRPSTEPDKEALSLIQNSLMQRQLLPDKQVADMGYVTVEHLLRSREEHSVELIGKVQKDTSWQGRESPDYALACFEVNWEAQQVTCPQGKLSRSWSPGYDSHDHPVIHVRFATADCRSCPVRQQCTRSLKHPRGLQFRHRPAHEALAEARLRQETQEFWEEYKPRAGIEGTISQAVRAFGLRRTRYIGSTKTHLQHLLIAAGVNFIRLADWFAGTKRAKTRTSHFAALCPDFCT